MPALRLLPAAETELVEAAAWYESRRPGLGIDFVAEVDAAFEKIVALPETFPLWREDRPYRRMRVRRFPYLVFYRILPDDIEVAAIAHMKRRPGYWSER